MKFDFDSDPWECRGGRCCVAAAVIGASAVSAGVTALTANNAAGQQTNATNQANQIEQQQFQQSAAGLSPYNAAGQQATGALTSLTGIGAGGNPLTSPLLAPMQLTEAQLQATPGYQFDLTQGLKSTQNAAAARGLGVSGAALKGAASYATGLADNTYQNQFADYQTNQTNAYNKLAGIAGLGENAAASTGNLGVQTAANIGANTIGAGNANAAASLATGNAIGGAANSAGSLFLLNSLLQSSGQTGLFGK